MKKTVLKVWTGNIWEALYPETSADCVKMSDGQSVEAVLNTLATFNPSEYVKKTNYATNQNAGIIKAQYAYGFYGAPTGELILQMASESDIATKTQQYRPVVPYNLDNAVKTSVTTNTIELTDKEKTAACGWIGAIPTPPATTYDRVLIQRKGSGLTWLGAATAQSGGSIPIREADGRVKVGTPTSDYDATTKKYVDDKVANVATGGTIDLSEYVKKTDYANIDTYGLIKLGYGTSGLALDSSGILKLAPADVPSITAKDINKSGNRCIPAYLIDDAVKIGVTTNTIELTDEEKTAACGWVGALKSKAGETYKGYVYSTSWKGEDNMRAIGENYTSTGNGSLAMYVTPTLEWAGVPRGALWTATPQYQYQCATKAYVDEEIEDKLNGISGLYEHIVRMTVETQEHDQIELIIRFLSGSSESFGDGEFLLEELVNAINLTIRPLLIDDASYLGLGVISNIMDMWYNPNDGSLDITVNSVNGLDYRTLIQIINYDYEVTPYGEVV